VRDEESPTGSIVGSTHQLLECQGQGEALGHPQHPCHPRKLGSSSSFQLQPPPPLPQLLLAPLEAAGALQDIYPSCCTLSQDTHTIASVRSVGPTGYSGFISTQIAE